MLIPQELQLSQTEPVLTHPGREQKNSHQILIYLMAVSL